jgi:PAS domain S-box-containing protein
MTRLPTFDAIFAVMDAVSVGDNTARVAVPEDPPLDDPATSFAIALNRLLDDLAFRCAERERTAEALRASEHRYRGLAERTIQLEAANKELETFMFVAESAADAIVSADHCGKITYLNSAAARMFGWTPGEAVGQLLTILMPDRFHQAHLNGLARFLETREARLIGRTVAVVGRRKDGPEFPAELTLSAWEHEGMSFTGIIRDITQRKELERHLAEHTAALEAANRDLKAFNYSVAHDLRTPLRSIDGFSQALLEDYADKLDEQGREYLRRARESAQQMGELIDDLLFLSRVTRSELRCESVDLTALARSVLARLYKNEPKRKAELIIADGLIANGDARSLGIVFENLLDNAWKFTGSCPMTRIEVGARQEKGRPVYFVRDNGAGFDMAYAHKLFGVFQRLHSSADFEGTGIGLAVVQRIVQRHSGRVWAEGEPGRGATIYFTLNEEPQ